jgi:hypothetical protein
MVDQEQDTINPDFAKEVAGKSIGRFGLFYITLIVLICGLASVAFAQDTTINYKGQPPAVAMAPSMSAFSQDVCAIPVVGAVSSTVIGFAGGTMYTDKNCERIKLSKVLNDLGLKITAVAVLCQDDRVWEAMEMSGSPCPIGGAIGEQARLAWFKTEPKRFEKLYGKDWKPPVAAASANGDK